MCHSITFVSPLLTSTSLPGLSIDGNCHSCAGQRSLQALSCAAGGKLPLASAPAARTLLLCGVNRSMRNLTADQRKRDCRAWKLRSGHGYQGLLALSTGPLAARSRRDHLTTTEAALPQRDGPVEHSSKAVECSCRTTQREARGNVQPSQFDHRISQSTEPCKDGSTLFSRENARFLPTSTRAPRMMKVILPRSGSFFSLTIRQLSPSSTSR